MKGMHHYAALGNGYLKYSDTFMASHRLRMGVSGGAMLFSIY